jgi:hypothetical protein
VYRSDSGDAPEKDIGAEKVKNFRSALTGDRVGREMSSSWTSSTGCPIELSPVADGGEFGVNKRSIDGDTRCAGATPADERSRRREADALGT